MKFNIDPDAVALSPDQMARGPKLGFLGAFEAAANEAYYTTSLFGAEIEMSNAEERNNRLIQSLGETPPPTLMGATSGPATRPYTTALDYMSKPRLAADDDEGRTGFVAQSHLDALLGERNKQLIALKEKYPDAGIKTYDDMYSDLQVNAQTARDRWRNSSTSWLGSLGGFLGAAAMGMHPAANPINFATMGVGGVGKTVVGRIAAQGVGQGAIEALDQVTGAWKTRQFTGDAPATSGDIAMSILGATAGGAVLQGAGEGLGRLFRLTGRKGGRWFEGPDAPPAPVEPSGEPAARSATTFQGVDATLAQVAYRDGLDAVLPHTDFGETAAGRAILRRDVDELSARLASWSEHPADMPPPGMVRSDAAFFPTGKDVQRGNYLNDTFRKAAGGLDGDVNEVARNLDNPTFVAYDRLSREIDKAREDLGLFSGVDSLERTRADLEAKIATLQKEAERKGTRRAIDALTEKIENLRKGRTPTPLPEAKARLETLAAKRQKLYPAIERAYARAQGLWKLYEDQAASVKTMVEAGKQGVDPFGFSMGALRRADTTPRPTTFTTTLGTRNVTPQAGETVAQAMQRVSAEGVKALDEAVQQYQASVGKLLADAEKTGEISIEGAPPLKVNEQITVPNLDGEGERTITVKQLLEETREDNEVLNAVGSCSVVKTS